jgi:hypothetical protein
VASLSGGKYFGNANNYEKIIQDIHELTASYYVLGYSVDEKWDGQYHGIKVLVKRKGCTVNAQKGYFNPKPFREYSEIEKKLQLIDLALNERTAFEEPTRLPLTTLSFSMREHTILTMLARIPAVKIQEIAGKDMEIFSLIFDEQKQLSEYERREFDIASFSQNLFYYHTSSSLEPGPYSCHVVIRNMETGKGAVASSSVTILKSPDSGIKLHAPLLLLPKKNGQYLKSSPPAPNEEGGEFLYLAQAYPFDSTEYSPLVQEMEPGLTRLRAVLRCSIIQYDQKEVGLSARLIELSTGKEMVLPINVLGQSQDEDNKIFLLEFETGELSPGTYALYITAVEAETGPVSSTFSTFLVR